MKTTHVLLLCLLFAAAHTTTAVAQTPKYKFPKTISSPTGAGNLHDQGAPKNQCIYRPADLPGLPEVAINSIYLRVGRTYGNPNPTIFTDVRIKMGYSKDSGFFRKTGATDDSFKTNLNLVCYLPSVSLYGADTVGTWVRFPVSNFAYSRSENLVVEISRGYQASPYGFDLMPKNLCNYCLLVGQYDSVRSSNMGDGYQADIGFNDSTGSASVGEVNTLTGFYTYPNPSNGLFTVGFEPSRSSEPIMVSVADMAGRQVWQRVYKDVQADLFTTNVDTQAATTSITPNPRLLEDSLEVFAPRIEAMSQYDPTTRPVPIKWQVNTCMDWVRLNNSTSAFPPPSQADPCGEPTVWQSAGYNNYTTPVPNSYTTNSCTTGPPYPMGTSHMDISSPFFVTEDIKGSCVAAGVGPAFSSNIGNQQYTVGFFPWQSSTSNCYERNINSVTGAFVNHDAYEVSTAPVDYPWDAAQSFAISNSSNSGADIWSAWYDGMDIMYKLSTPNVMAFRSALQTGIISNPFNKGVYPNPVSTALHVNGAIGEQYRITDVTGRELAGGNIPSNNTLNVGQLAVGTYMLFVSDASGKVQITKFTKN